MAQPEYVLASLDGIDLLLYTDTAEQDLLDGVDGSDRPRVRFLHESPLGLVMADTHVANFLSQLPVFLQAAEEKSIREFFRAIGAPLPSGVLLGGAGFAEDTVVNAAVWEDFKSFLYAYRWELLIVSRQKRRELFYRLLQLGVGNGMRIGILDTGRHGTGELALSRALEAMFDQVTTCVYRPDPGGTSRQGALARSPAPAE